MHQSITHAGINGVCYHCTGHWLTCKCGIVCEIEEVGEHHPHEARHGDQVGGQPLGHALHTSCTAMWRKPSMTANFT